MKPFCRSLRPVFAGLAFVLLATQSVWSQISAPILNEIVSSNISGPPDEYEVDLQNCPVPDCEQWYRDLGESPYDGDYPDWIEMHNPGASTISLAGYGLSDDPAKPFKWRFPQLSLDPGAYLVIFASGKDKHETYLHTNFKLSRGGETILLTDPEGQTVDFVEAGEIPVDFSLGRKANDDGESEESWVLFARPTPGEANLSPVFPGFTDAITASPPAGFFERLPQVSLASTLDDVDIRYTTDGSEPTPESRLYTRPVAALFAQTQVVRARSFSGDVPLSPILTQTYLAGRTFTMPVISLATAPAHLWDDELGIYTPGNNARESDRVANYWNDWERPVNIAFYEADGTLGFQVDAGLQIFGWGSRSDPQKSLSIMFRDRYGYPQIDYPVFPDFPISEFKALVLRAGGSDSRSNGTFFRDPFATGLVRNRNVDIQAFRPAIVYLNGEYWGIHNIREKMNEDYLASHHGIDPADVDMVSRYWRRRHVVVIEGDATEFEALETFLTEHDMREAAPYEEAKNHVDMENFLDYATSQVYFANYDWPGNNNKNWRAHRPGDKWRWLMYDLDYTLGFNSDSNFQHNTLAHATNPSGTDWPNPSWTTLIFRKFAENETFRHAFANRLMDLLNTIFDPACALAELEAMQERFASEMEAHIIRWSREGDSIGSIAAWERNIGTVRTFLQNRPDVIINHVKNTFSLDDAATVHLEVSPPESGSIALNSITIETSPWSGRYFTGLPLRLQALPKSGHRFTHWSGTEATSDESLLELALTAPATTLTAHFEEEPGALNMVVINEINYHSASDHDPGEWIELYNGYAFPMDLSHWVLRDSIHGHRFTFPEGTVVDANGYLVLCSDSEAFQSLFPHVVSCVGGIPFSFGNGADSVRLYDRQGRLVDAVDYDDEGDWPVLADGTGRTLTLTTPHLDNHSPTSWRASQSPYGTPGAENDTGIVSPPISISSPAIRHRLGEDTFVLEFPTEREKTYELERSIDLLDWNTWKTETGTGSRLTVEVERSGRTSYFRLKEKP